MRKVRILLILLAITASCWGCGRQVQTPQAARIVTAISVTYENGPIHTQRHYTASDKMRTILHYLRFIDCHGKPEEDPETVTGSSIRIELTYSDGKTKTYWQKADQYLLEEGKDWQKIDPKHGLDLSRILGQMESDEI